MQDIETLTNTRRRDEVIVERLTDESRAAWDGFVDAHPEATVYHTNWWRDTVVSSFGHRSYPLIARGPSGEIQGVLPLFHVRGLLSGRLVSSPLRDRGGALGDPGARRALAGAARRLAEELSCRYVLLKQGESSPELTDDRYVEIDHWVTMLLDLPARWERLNPKVRWSVRKGEHSGLSFEMSDTVEAGERFYRLFRETRRRLGVPTYACRFFRALAGQPAVRFCFASQHGADVAGIVLLLQGRRAVSGYAANSSAGRAFRASEFAYWHAIRWSSEQGYRIFDFGADSPHQTGVRQFKEKWDAREVPVPHYYFLSRVRRVPLRDSSNGVLRLLRKPWSWLPGPLFEIASDWAVRHVD
ncbi:MAG TPA: GNAT family N-acetyltransferase [Methylomirabilota bacterium]|nr:GNAT family N-acetyltransferase [Methylomirabilota bacterium]